jgi:hypothetical protein
MRVRTIKMTTLIGNSFDRTIEILFRPFSVKKWLRLLLIAFLAGAIAAGNGPGGGGGNPPPEKKKPVETAAKQAGVSERTDKIESETTAAGTEKFPESAKRLTAILFIIGAVLFIIALILLTWISARLKFIWLNAIVKNTTEVIEPYSRHAAEANSLFKFSMVLLVLFIAFLGLLGFSTLVLMALRGVFSKEFVWSVPTALKIFLIPGLLFLTAILTLLTLAFFFDHFIIPIMAFDKLRAIPALRKFGRIFLADWWDISVFTLVFFLLSFVGGAGNMALAIIVIIPLLLIAAVILGIPLATLWFLLKAKIAFIIYAVVVGVPFAVVSLLILMATALPFAVFFRLLSLNYLVSLTCGYTKETLDGYVTRRAERLARKAPIITSVMVLFLVFSVVIGGLLAAIAIPNFVKAREAALPKQKAILSQPASSP